MSIYLPTRQQPATIPAMNSKPSTYVTKVDTGIAKKMVIDLESQGFVLSQPQHTVFSAKKKGVSVTLYSSGKLLVQGKDMAEFIEFYLEPHILQTFEFSHPEQIAGNTPYTPHIGVDESGKGDFFGPLCIAGVYAGPNDLAVLKKIGVCDSKKVNDKAIGPMAKKIRDNLTCHVIRINPKRYNELYLQFGNLNHLLAWGHATTIEELSKRTGCQEVLIDQFANERVVATALKRKGIELNLKQRHRAEEDPVVAAASILAREAFLSGLKKLSEQYSVPLPKGASAQVIAAGKRFLQEHGRPLLPEVCKAHFKTLFQVTGEIPEGKDG